MEMSFTADGLNHGEHRVIGLMGMVARSVEDSEAFILQNPSEAFQSCLQYVFSMRNEQYSVGS